jgi:hypothetical protein
MMIQHALYDIHEYAGLLKECGSAHRRRELSQLILDRVDLIVMEMTPTWDE